MFVILRQGIHTIQGVLTEQDGVVSHNMVKWAEYLNRESVVYIEGLVQTPQDGQAEIKATTIHEIEIKIEKVNKPHSLPRALFTNYHQVPCHCNPNNRPPVPS